jgi:hypothetical protein
MFSRRKPVRFRKPKDDFERAIDDIEKFAPREYSKQREMCYYNYRMVGLYANPLLALLRLLTQRDRPAGDDPQFDRELFLCLKSFYDPKGRLSDEEAWRDPELGRKFRELCLLFRGRKNVSVPAAEDGGRRD